MDMYALLYLKGITKKELVCAAHGTLLDVTWWPGREGSLGESGYMYIYG